MKLVNGQKPEYLVFFDVDYTLVNGATGTAFGVEMFRHGLIRWPDLIRVALWTFRYKLGRISEVAMWRHATEALRGNSDAVVQRVCREAYERVVHRRVFADAVETLAHHQKNGGAAVLVSAGPRYVVDALAQVLGPIPHVTAWPNVVDGFITDLDAVDIPIGPEKRVAAERICGQQGIDPRKCWAYGDSAGDLEMLKFVGHPVAVNPRRKLRRAAKEGRWDIVKWSRITTLPRLGQLA